MIFSRWSVVYKHDQQPIEGCVYVHKAEADKRMRGMADTSKYEVKEVTICPKDVMDRLLAKLSDI